MGERLLEKRFKARAEELKVLRDALRTTISKTILTPLDTERVILAVNEACMNVIQHAYKGESNGEIVLEVFNHETDVEVRITDFAPPVDPEKIRPRALHEVRPGGLGTHFMQELMDDVHYLPYDSSAGNCLVMKKYKGKNTR